MARAKKGRKTASVKKAGPAAAATGNKRRGAKKRPAPGTAKKKRQAAAASPSGPAPTAPKSRRGASNFPIVAIGASAGGLDALKRFLAAMPADSGLALVLIPHLDPTHESLMVELLGKQTKMPVLEAVHGARIKPNHVYIIPPAKYLAIQDRRVVLSKPPEPHGLQTVIDFALRSLAESQGEAAIGIILSGTGSHGTQGVKEIKLEGGLVLAQEPETAEFDQMPRSAIATGLMDYVLPPEKMPEAIIRYLRHDHAGKGEKSKGTEAESGLQRVLALLQTRAGSDFRYYRKNTILRRIRRRMALLQFKDIQEYIEHLRRHADEVTALRKDLLIGVTTFFRDTEAFAVLARDVLPKLVERAHGDSPIRVWVPACATGEEAYSIAILLMEQIRKSGKAVNIQMFATDMDTDSVATARQAIYPDSIADAVSPERLQRFFVRIDEHNFQVGKHLRDSIVFAPQNLISDAPFSRLDLISCRNLLIYLEPEIQEKVISLLHFALKDDGYLLLGPSETIGRKTSMFEPLSRKWRIYRRKGPLRRELVSIPVVTATERIPGPAPAGKAHRPGTDLMLMMQKLLLEDFAPASVLINRDYEILSVQGPLVNYLEFPPGAISRNLLSMARQGLRIKIRAACQKAIRGGEPVTEPDARVRRNGGYMPCTLTVRPITESGEVQGLLLVVFQDRIDAKEAGQQGKAEPAGEYAVVTQLEEELRATRADLQSYIEDLESANEELKASNEEVVSMNEELQSTNEELETSREELQSLNEELTTVNSQLQEKIDDLDNVNNDLTNLLAATDIATVFLDTELRIKRFTPSTGALFNLVATDVGRPLGDLAPKFRDEDMLRDAHRVMETLVPREKLVHADENHWYLRKVVPYRSGDDRIGGVVITLTDITERVEAEAQARRIATVLRDSNDAVIICNFKGRITAWNKSAERMYGYSEAEALKKRLDDLVPADLKDSVAQLTRRAAQGEPSEAVETRRIARDGAVHDVSLTMTPVRDEEGRPVAMATTERDITLHLQAQDEIRRLNAMLEQRVTRRTAELQASDERIRSVMDAAIDAIISIDSKGKIQTANSAVERIFGYTAAELIGQNVSILMPSPYREEHDGYLARYLETGKPRLIGDTRELVARRKDGGEFPILLSVNEVRNLGLFTGVVHDISRQKTLQEEIVNISTLEQRRIGYELHDNTQQELTGLGLLAQQLSEQLKHGKMKRESEAAAKLASGIAETSRHVQSIARGLVPMPVDAQGLMSALHDLAERTEELHGISCRFEGSSRVDVRDNLTATHLFRIAQEAVTNAIKHARAGLINIRLDSDKRELTLEVRDDGIGVVEQANHGKGLGLRVMEHRCALIGGQLTVTRHKAGGTSVSCTIPHSIQD